jgi:NADH-quinone oxidoreductase subunit H
LFLGGWRSPWPVSRIPGANEGWVTLIWFFIKILLFMFVFVWLRGTLPRIRYDQFMTLGWKILVPISLVWIVLVSTARVLNSSTSLSTRQVLLYMGIPLVVILLAAAFWPQKKHDEDEDEDELLAIERTEVEGSVIAPNLGAYPVPPMDLQVPIPPIRDSRPAITAGSTADTSEGASSVVS